MARRATIGRPWCIASSSGTQKPSWQARRHEHVGVGIVGSQAHAVGHRAGEGHGALAADLLDEGTEARLVEVRRRSPPRIAQDHALGSHTMQHHERLDHVVLCLVRAQSPDEQPLGTPAELLVGQGHRRERTIGLAGHVARVEQDRHHGSIAIAGAQQVLAVELRVGDGEVAHRREVGELAQTHVEHGRHGGLPRLEERRRGDVVVVDDLRMRAAHDEPGHRRAGRRLVQDPRPAAHAEAVELLVGQDVGTAHDVGPVDVDVRFVAEVLQKALDAERVRTDRVARRQRRSDW